MVKEHSAKKYEIPSTNKVIKVAEARKQNESKVQAGVERVAAIKIPHHNSYLVSKEAHPKYADNQQQLSHGYLLNTHSNNQTKVKQLTRISHELKLDWRVEQIK